MIETHVVNALLQISFKEDLSFRVLTFVNGLVAPTFLFCAGFAFAISVHRKWEQYIAVRQAFRRYFIRLLFILIVGYSLHVPFFSLRRILSPLRQDSWVSFFQVDILQTIAVTLMLLSILVVLLRREKVFVKVSALIAIAIVFAAPVIVQMDLTALPIWLRPYLTTQFKS